MKFFCDSCSTKYSISDEKVRGKVLKVRCKNCGHVITVQEQRLPTQADDSSAKQPPSPPPSPKSPGFDPQQVDWHYALNGQSFGPFGLQELRERYRSGELGDETYVWTESFSNWKPVAEVEWFEDALAKGQERSPRRNTIGVSGALEAIKPEDVDKFQSKKGKGSNTQRQRAVEQDRNAAQQDRLHALRARLRDQRSGDSEGGAPDAQPKTGESSEPASVDAVGPTEVDDREAAPSDSPVRESGGEESDLFDGLEDAPPSGDTVDETERSGRIPFSPKAPELESESRKRRDEGNDEGITGSLLTKMDEIQKEGRGGRVLLVAAAVLLVAGVIGIGLYLHFENQDEEAASDKVAEVEQPEKDGSEEVKVKTYSDDERKKILTIGSQEVGESGDEVAEGGEGEAGSDTGDAPRGEKSEQELAAADTKSKDDGGDLTLRGASLGESGMSMDEALAGAQKSKKTDDRVRKKLDEGSTMGAALDSPISQGSAFESMGGVKSDRSSAIYKPTDSVEEEKKVDAPRLTRDQLSRGFRNVRRSVGVCQQRHARRGGPLEARKIYVTLQIRPSGRVKDFELEPGTIQNTEFARCMNSHKARWKFPSFGGSEPQKVRAPYVLD